MKLNKLATSFSGSLVLLAFVVGCGSDSGTNSGDSNLNGNGGGSDFNGSGGSFNGSGGSGNAGSVSSGGSGSGSVSASDAIASCKTTCAKVLACTPSAGAFLNCDTLCNQQTFTSSGNCDYGQLKSALDQCATVDCTSLTGCYQQASTICGGTPSGAGGAMGSGGTGSDTGGTGADTGGTAGEAAGGTGADTGGTSGATGGATGGDPCAPCAKAATCCPPLYTKLGQDPSGCSLFSSLTCTFAGSAQASLISGCTQLLTQGASQGVAECQ